MFFAGDKAPDRRKTSVTYVELARLANILTGGAIGPRRGTYAEKAAIMKEGILQLTKKAVVNFETGDCSMPADRFFCHLNTVCSASPVGFPALPGISRRPLLTKYSGTHATLGAMLKFAKKEELVLDSVMPRYIWLRPCWKADSVLSTWEQVMAIQAGEKPDTDNLVPNLQPFQILPQSKKPTKQTGSRTDECAGRGQAQTDCSTMTLCIWVCSYYRTQQRETGVETSTHPITRGVG